MPRYFPPYTNVIARYSLFGVFLILSGTLLLALISGRSSYGTGQAIARVQPVPFSHEHHAGELGIDCRYCHTTVETSTYAGMPPTKTCMNCHSQIWVGSDMLAPVRNSYRDDVSLHWKRIYNLPGFVYFDHSIHVHKGVGCSSCHGRVDLMPFTYQVPSLLMEWCLDCHRDPAQHLRPREAVFDMNWLPPSDQAERGRDLMRKYHVKDARQLTSCSECHR